MPPESDQNRTIAIVLRSDSADDFVLGNYLKNPPMIESLRKENLDLKIALKALSDDIDCLREHTQELEKANAILSSQPTRKKWVSCLLLPISLVAVLLIALGGNLAVGDFDTQGGWLNMLGYFMLAFAFIMELIVGLASLLG